MAKNVKSYVYGFFLLLLCFITISCATTTDNLREFPLENYTQDVDHWLHPSSPNYNKPLLTNEYQKLRFQKLKTRYYGTGESDLSPWSEVYVNKILNAQGNNSIYAIESNFINSYDNTQNSGDKIGYGMNYRTHNYFWFKSIEDNVNVSRLNNLKYQGNKRAIAIDNILTRALPTNDPFFYSYKIAGQGYPFDMFQVSSIYAGTSLYIIASSMDKKWHLILSPSFIGWVDARKVAYVDSRFIASWQKHVNTNLGGIINNEISVFDNNGNYLFTGYVGTLLPLAIDNKKANDYARVFVPVKTEFNMAKIITAYINKDDVTKLPLLVTPANFAKIFKVMQYRPYGWGNLGFYNDCSAELKNIYAVFGIFLPRNSASQEEAGKVVNLTKLSAKDRINYLMNNGKPLMTLIRMSGHVMLYVGNYTDSAALEKYPLTYQQMWGLAPKDRSYRAVIGQSVFLPLWLQYPEDENLNPQADNPIFNLVYLDEEPSANKNLSIDY